MFRSSAGIAIVLPLFLCADFLNQGEREFAVKNLKQTRALFWDAVGALSTEQWNYKPAAERWSIAEIAEHIALSEDKIFGDALSSLKRRDPDPAKRPTDEAVMKFMTDRSIKAQAPDYLQPKRSLDQKAMVARFLASRDRKIKYMESTKDDLRHHYTSGPLGPMDAYQAIIGMSGHSEKHIAQMRDVMASDGYPKK